MSDIIMGETCAECGGDGAIFRDPDSMDRPHRKLCSDCHDDLLESKGL